MTACPVLDETAAWLALLKVCDAVRAGRDPCGGAEQEPGSAEGRALLLRPDGGWSAGQPVSHSAARLLDLYGLLAG